MKIAYIACDNGLGHIRRSLLVSEKLCTFSDVKVFCETEKFLKIKSKYGLSELISNENIGFSLNEKNLNNYKKAKTFFKKIKEYNPDLIISDNLIHYNFFRYSKTIFIANFFWHEINRNLFIRLRNAFVLNYFKPVIFGSKIFATESVRKQENFHPIGLVDTNQKELINTKDSILISGGSTNIIRSELQSLIAYLLNKELDISNIFVDDQLKIPNTERMGFSITKADYSNEMFSKLKLAVVRPGLGVISELLKRKVAIFSLDLENNNEIKSNNFFLEKNKLAVVYKEISEEIVLDISKFLKGDIKFENFYSDFTGADSIRSYIRNLRDSNE